ncbi:heat-shock protein Hsp20 [Mesorhizobium sp. 131-3-5]|uniref:Hsp20 family protein n=1 Tax=Mesorhizobium sp. 131-3-5 TaxID=2744520 RepID=UPI00037C11EA|nr:MULTISPECIES: Hsp20 family protein [Mesorhizobium]ANN58259.1 heat-shock protein [Mesorhizobium loti NZP2037]BCH08885.1 heat-shock protein Hsp20 [Mesorhizobium sp. 131-3-5]
MRTFDSLYRTTVGFDRLFDMLENNARTDWPPYNIEKTGENAYRIAMAIAGFSSEEVELTQNGPELVVVGQKSTDTEGRQVLHQGLALRNFRHVFKLADHMKVVAATLENGLLSVEIVREIPEELKPRRINIGSGDAMAVNKQISQDVEKPRKVA